MKTCTKCGIEKALDDFNRRLTSKDDYGSQCRACNSINARARYQRNKEKVALAGKERYTKVKADPVLYEIKKEKDRINARKRRLASDKEQVNSDRRDRYNQSEELKAKAKRDYSIYYKANRDKVLESNKWARNNTLDGRYITYKGSAKKRKIPFSLTKEEFSQYWQVPCQYCGDEIGTIGLDRIANSEGYTIDNIVACCKVCNYMKRHHSVEEFVSKCAQVVAKMG